MLKFIIPPVLPNHQYTRLRKLYNLLSYLQIVQVLWIRWHSIHYIVSFSWVTWFNSQPTAHCSYLDIYISQNIRLCKCDFEGKFQTILQAKGINFFIWKFRFIILIFLLVFAEFVKSTAFCTLLLLFQRVDMFE